MANTLKLPSPGAANTSGKRKGAKAAAASIKNKYAGLRAKAKEMTGHLITTGEMVGAAALSSAVAGYRFGYDGKDLKIGPVDGRILVGLAGIIHGLWNKKVNTHTLALGTGVIASWACEAANDMAYRKAVAVRTGAPAPAGVATGPGMATPATIPVAAGVEGVAMIDASGQFLVGRVNKQALEKRAEHLQNQLFKVRAQLRAEEIPAYGQHQQQYAPQMRY